MNATARMHDAQHRRRHTGGAALVAALAIAAGGLTGALAPAVAADVATTSAYGVEILDIDGGTLQARAPYSQWTDGPTVINDLGSTTDPLLLNTTQARGLSSRAASDGAMSTVASGTFQLRERPAVEFTGLRATCTTDGTSSVAFDTLTVDGQDVLRPADLSEGYTYDLPTSRYGETTLYVGQRVTDTTGTTTTTALRIEAEAGASEIWRVRLGVVSCAPAPEPVVPVTASGVTVTAQDGTALIDQQPRLTSAGQQSASELTATGVIASGVSIAQNADSSARVGVTSFEQVPDTSAVGPYMWNALRVYGLTLDVASDGTSTVSFSNQGSAVFANGVWINTGTDLYTGVGPDGTARVRVYLNERVPNPDGSVTITALRYEDLTGTYPDVTLGRIVWSPPAAPVEPVPTPEPQPGVSLPDLYAYAIAASGASPVSPAALSAPDGESSAGVSSVDDGLTGQIVATGLTSSVGEHGSAAGVATLLLYPGTALETRLSDLRVAVSEDGIIVTTAGGTVAGTTVPAGPITANTTVAVPGRTATIVLNAQDTSDGVLRVAGVSIDDPVGLGADVRAAVVTTDAPDVTPTPQPEPGDGAGPGPAVPTPGKPTPGMQPGALDQNAPTADAAGPATAPRPGHLAVTGGDGVPLLVGGVVIALAGVSLVMITRRRRGPSRR